LTGHGCGWDRTLTDRECRCYLARNWHDRSCIGRLLGPLTGEDVTRSKFDATSTGKVKYARIRRVNLKHGCLFGAGLVLDDRETVSDPRRAKAGFTRDVPTLRGPYCSVDKEADAPHHGTRIVARCTREQEARSVTSSVSAGAREPPAELLRRGAVSTSRAARQLVVAYAVMLAVAGCGTASTTEATPRGSGTSVDAPEPRDRSELEAPPPVRIIFGTGSLELRPYTFCYRAGCADGMSPANPPDIGRVPVVRVEFPLEDWRFEASFQAAGDEHARVRTARLQRQEDGSFLLRPVGPPETYDVTLVGRGGGDLSTKFRWSTPSAGPLERPAATLAVLADHDGDVDSYGIEMVVTNLDRTPKEADATVTVAAANGKSLTFAPDRANVGRLPQGTVSWNGPDAQGAAAVKLGPPPFTYTVILTLDGTRHTATAHWPDDVIEGNEPSVALNFSPALPAES